MIQEAAVVDFHLLCENPSQRVTILMLIVFRFSNDNVLMQQESCERDLFYPGEGQSSYFAVSDPISKCFLQKQQLPQ